MAAAFQFGMPAINFSEICNVKRTYKQRRQLYRKRVFMIDKWRKSYAYQLIKCGRNKIDYYNYLVDSAYTLYDTIIQQMGMNIFNDTYTELYFSNIKEYNNMKQTIHQLYTEINSIKDKLRELILTLTYTTYENIKEMSQFTNIYVEQFKL